MDIKELNTYPIEWEALEEGLNLGASSLVLVIDKELADGRRVYTLFARDGACRWIQKTMPITAPAVDFVPARSEQKWYWVKQESLVDEAASLIKQLQRVVREALRTNDTATIEYLRSMQGRINGH